MIGPKVDIFVTVLHQPVVHIDNLYIGTCLFNDFVQSLALVARLDFAEIIIRKSHCRTQRDENLVNIRNSFEFPGCAVNRSRVSFRGLFCVRIKFKSRVTDLDDITEVF